MRLRVIVFNCDPERGLDEQPHGAPGKGPRRMKKRRRKNLITSQVSPSNWPIVGSFADKAKDLDAFRIAVVEAASVSMGLWFSFLFVLFYLAIAVGSVTHRDLLFANPVKLPFLNVELPLVGFFIIAPVLFLVIHAFVLLHLVILAGKLSEFDTELRARTADPVVQERLRRQLPSVIFVQLLAGPDSVRTGVLGLMLRLVAQISLIVGPITLLVLFELQFLPFHRAEITWWHRIAVLLDLAILWLLWPSIADGKVTWIGWRDFLHWRIAGAAAASILTFLFVVTLALFPGEWLEDKLPATWKSLHEIVISGEADVDPITRRPTSLWPNSNRIVLPGLDIIDHAKLDSDEKLAAVSETLSLRTRRLEGAVLYNANLKKVDLTGARLKGANFKDARLQGALLNKAELNEAIFIGANLEGAFLQSALLNGARLNGASLQGANLFEADLSGAEFEEARLFCSGAFQGKASSCQIQVCKTGSSKPRWR